MKAVAYLILSSSTDGILMERQIFLYATSAMPAPTDPKSTLVLIFLGNSAFHVMAYYPSLSGFGHPGIQGKPT